MIYIKINVSDIESTMRFYSEQLELFDRIGDRRLSCKFGPQLILDFRDSTPSIVAFGIRFKEISILDSLKEKKIPYKIEENLSGQSLYVYDPHGNEIWISTDSGEIH